MGKVRKQANKTVEEPDVGFILDVFLSRFAILVGQITEMIKG